MACDGPGNDLYCKTCYSRKFNIAGTVMSSQVLILDGNSEIGVHARNDACYLICLRHLFRSRLVTNLKLFSRKELFFLLRAQYVLSYHIRYSLSRTKEYP